MDVCHLFPPCMLGVIILIEGMADGELHWIPSGAFPCSEVVSALSDTGSAPWWLEQGPRDLFLS